MAEPNHVWVALSTTIWLVNHGLSIGNHPKVRSRASSGRAGRVPCGRRSAEHILTMNLAVTAVQTAVCAGRCRPSTAK